MLCLAALIAKRSPGPISSSSITCCNGSSIRRRLLAPALHLSTTTAAATASSSPIGLEVLYEDKHLVVVNKPPGVLSQGGAYDTNIGGAAGLDMLSLVRARLAAATGKPVYLGLVHRLDRNVSGCMVLAKRSKVGFMWLCVRGETDVGGCVPYLSASLCACITITPIHTCKQAAARLSEAFREWGVVKEYVAVVLGEVPMETGGQQQQRTRTLRHALAFDNGHQSGFHRGTGTVSNVTRVLGEAPAAAAAAADDGRAGGKAVVGTLRYTPLLVFPHPHRPGEKETLLRVELVSGRKHQIRAQLSYVEHPIVGDVKYGAPVALRDRSIALHCRALRFAHPKRGWEGGEGRKEPGGDDDEGTHAVEGEEEGDKEHRREGRVMVDVRAPLPPAWRARFGDVVVDTVEGMG